jgi:hypothetical protein
MRSTSAVPFRCRSTSSTAAVPLAVAMLACAVRAQAAADAALQVSVDLTNLPAVTFHWPADPTATGYTIARRIAGTSNWSAPVNVPGGGSATSWLDSTVLYGLRYEYWFSKSGTPAAKNVLTVGVQAPLQDQRGAVVLLVDATKVAVLGARLDRLVEDLAGDGWTVLRHDVGPAQSAASVKALIAADVAANPGQVQAVFLLGHVPVPYSGSLAPDGHPDHQGAWPADCYYGELHGPWTDTSVNVVTATRLQNRNVPGDGKFDQTSLPSDVDLAVGRVDFRDLPAFAASEDALLQQYLDKDHDYRHKVFAVDQRAVIDDNFGYFGGEAFAASGWRNFASLVGPANVVAADYFATLNAASGNGWAWSYGCGGGSYTSAGGIGSTANFAASANRGVFTMLFGSYFGDWDSTDNLLRAALGSGWTLANVWAGRPHWSFHAMGLGAPIGACARTSQNDTLMGGYGQRYVHMALMGDPTLRQHVVAPAGALTVTDQWPQAQLAWAQSPDLVSGYHVYRASAPLGPFTRLTAAPVAATTFVDALPLAGPSTYMVRAIRHEATPTGTYWNASQGVFASTTLPQQVASHTAYGAGCGGLTLAASPAPVSTATAGTVVTYTIGSVPEAAPSSGVYVGLTIVAFTGDVVGTPLASLGMPGCSLWVGELDVTTAFVGSSPVQQTTLALPPGLPPGSELFATAAAMFVPGTIAGNTFGAVTSNGVRSFVNAF